jgi:hypothetical protein
MGEAAFEQIVPFLLDESARVRLAATEAIGRSYRISPNTPKGAQLFDRSAELLQRQLADDSPRVRQKAAVGLAFLGRARLAVDTLLAMVNEPDDYARASVFSAILEAGDPRAVDVFLAGLKDPHNGVRWRSAEGLGRFRARQAVEPLLAALESDDGTLRVVAARALGQIGDRRALTPLLEIANTDPEPRARQAAGRAVAQIEHPNVAPSETAWGEPVNNVQLGLVCVSGVRPYRMGEIVRYQRVIRNTDDRDWTIELVRGGHIVPRVDKGRVVLHSGRFVNGSIFVRKVTVPGGATVTLDTSEFILRPVRWKEIDQPQSLRIAPGKYRVNTIYYAESLVGRDAPEGTWTEKLTTGELELTVLADAH